ncbi:LRR-GTPase of the ROCO family [Pelomyxa schiedti]|nr:LRR-GTPase of the ROCO family [Pelomyxa schiedti]
MGYGTTLVPILMTPAFSLKRKTIVQSVLVSELTSGILATIFHTLFKNLNWGFDPNKYLPKSVVKCLRLDKSYEAEVRKEVEMEGLGDEAIEAFVDETNDSGDKTSPAIPSSPSSPSARPEVQKTPDELDLDVESQKSETSLFVKCYAKAKQCKFTKDMQVVTLLIVFGVAGCIISTIINAKYSWSAKQKFAIKLYIAIMVLAMGIIIIFFTAIRLIVSYRWWKIAILGVITGFNKGISGGGYGPIAICGRPQKNAIAATSASEAIISLCGIICSLACNAIQGIGSKGDYDLVVYLIIGSTLATPFAAYLTRIVRTKVLRYAVGIATSILGIIQFMRRPRAHSVRAVERRSVFYLLFVVLAIVLEADGSTLLEEASTLCDIKRTNSPSKWVLDPCSFTSPCQHPLSGVTCNSNGHVKGLSLSYSNMSGTLPPSIGNLWEAQQMEFDFNDLTGSIPDVFTSMMTVSTWSSLNNRLSGTIPASLMLSTILYINLENNTLTGSIPAAVSNLSAVELISFMWNNLDGTVPSELGNLPYLEHIWLAENNLAGTVPSSLFSLTRLLSLDLGGNLLTGTIPPSVCNVSEVVYLILSNNQLYGTVPDCVFNLSSITYIYLDHNQFSGVISNAWTTSSHLKFFDLSENQFRGTIPNTIILKNLESLNLANNLFSGTPPNATSPHLSCNVSQNCLYDTDTYTSPCIATPTRPVDMCACVADGTRCWIDGVCITTTSTSPVDPCLDTRQQQQQQQQPAAFGSIYGGGGCGVVVGGMHAASPPTSGGGGGGSPMNGNYGYPQPPPQTSGTTPNCISVPGSVGHSLISPLVRLGSNPSPIIGPPSPPSPGVVLSHSQQVQGGGFSTQHSPVEGPHVSLNTDGLPRNLSSMPHPQLQLALATAAAAPSHTSATGLTSNSPVVNSQSVPSHNTIPSARMSVSRNTNHMQANSTGIPGVLNGNQPSMPQTHQHSASPQAQPIPLTSLNNNSPLPQVVPSPTPLPTDESLLGLVNPSMLMGINPWSPGLPFVSPTQMVTQTPSGTTNPPTGVLTGMGASQTVSSGQLPPGSIGTSNLLQSTHVQQLPNQFQQINLAHGAMGMNVGVSSGNVSSTSRLLPLDQGANVGVSMVPPVYQNPPGIPAQRANSGSLSPTQHSPASGNLGQQNSNSIELPPVVHSSTTTPSSAPMIQDMSIAIRDSSSLQDRYLMNMSPRQASRSRSRRRSRSSSRADIDESEEMAPPPENSLEPFGSASPALHVASQPGHKYVDITEYLTLPQADAAHKLGIPTSTLSKRWKEAVRSRKWPYRTVAKLDKEIMTLLHNIPQGASAYPLSKDVEASLGQLMRRRQDELKPVVRRL